MNRPILHRALRLPSFQRTRDITQHPLFRGEISRWTWRFIVYRITQSGRWFLFASVVYFLYVASTSLDQQGIVVLSYALVMWAASFVAMFLCVPRGALRVFMPDRVCAGETVPVEVEWSQRRWLAGAELSVLPYRLPDGVFASPEEGALIPPAAQGEISRARLGLYCGARGHFHLHGWLVDTPYPLGLMRAYRILKEDRLLVVYPRFTPLAHFAIPSGRRYQPGGVALASSLGEAFEYLGNREYREGDAIRDIDWRATARLQKPIVREYREEYFLRVAVILDTHVPKRSAPLDHEAFERAVSVCAAVADFMARQEYLVDLFAAGPNLYHLTAGRSLAYLDQILDLLACVEESRTPPFDVIEPEIIESLSQITTVICVFLDWDETRRAFAHRLGQEGASVKVIVVRDRPPTQDPAADDIVAGRSPIVTRQAFETGEWGIG